jgi:glyoxylase-like metal-dependent hydrolase (beta-lactamase superfamily II)
MNTSTYQFKVGDFDCAAISDGTFTYAPPTFPPPADLFFVNAPGERLAQALAEHGLVREQWGAWTSPYTCLLVDTGSSRVLIDTGADGLGPNTGSLLGSLESVGVDPEQIDLVILTHGHPDHLGGNTDGNGNLLFPKASWVMSTTEWDFWMKGQAEEVLPEHGRDVLLGFAHRNLSAIEGRVSLVPGEKEIRPGIRILPAPGHTPGHIGVAISSSGEELLCISDLVLHPLHLEEPGWFAAVDMLPDQLVAARRALLGRAAAEQCRVIAFHFPFPGLGRVLPKGAAWRWEPHGSLR